MEMTRDEAAGPVKRVADRSAPFEERLIVALDVSALEDAVAIVEKLDGVVTFYKIGFWLQFVPGLEGLMKSLADAGKHVFLDSKMYDIGESVKKGVENAAKLGIDFLTVHGNAEIIRAAVEGKAGTQLKILCVTVLTSLDEADLTDLGYPCSVEELVRFRVRKALQYGCDGVIASTHEARTIREIAGERDFLIVTPGIRPKGESRHDHKRSGTPAKAMAAGADYLVVGRPIIRSRDPAAAARRILAEMRLGWEARG